MADEFDAPIGAFAYGMDGPSTADVNGLMPGPSRWPSIAAFLKRLSPARPLNASAADEALNRALAGDRSALDAYQPTGLGGVAEDVGRIAKSAGAGALDPFNIPSAATGLVSPEARDAWRMAQADVPSAGMTGGMATGGGALGAFAKTAWPTASAIGAASNAGSDVLDAAAGGRPLGIDTAVKAGVGAMLPLPGRVQAGVGTAGLGALGLGTIAAQAGDGPTAALDAQEAAARARLTELDRAKEAAAKLQAAEWDKKRLGPAARKDAQAQFDQEWSGRASAVNDELREIGRARVKLLGDAATAQAAADASESARRASDAERERRQNTPINKLYPNETMAAQLAMIMAGMTGSGLVKGLNVRRAQAPAQALSEEAKTAAGSGLSKFSAGDAEGAFSEAARAKAAQDALSRMMATDAGRPSIMGSAGKAVAEAAPAVAGLEGAFIGPSIIDHYARAEPGSDLYNKTDPFKNWDQTVGRTAGAALTGTVMSKLFSNPVAALVKKATPIGAPGEIGALDALLGKDAPSSIEKLKQLRMQGDDALHAVQEGRRTAAEIQQRGAEAARLGREAMQGLDPRSFAPEAEAAARAEMARRQVQAPQPALPAGSSGSQPLLPPPASSGGQSPPPAVTSQDILDRLKTNKTYGEQTSSAVQKATIAAAKDGTSASGINATQLARDLGVPPTRVKNALANLEKIGADRGIDFSDPKQLRALAKELNADPRFANKAGTGNSLWSVAPVAALATALADRGEQAPSRTFEAGTRPEAPSHGTVWQLRSDPEVTKIALDAAVKAGRMNGKVLHDAMLAAGYSEMSEAQARRLSQHLKDNKDWMAQYEDRLSEVDRSRRARDNRAAMDTLRFRLRSRGE